MVTHFTFASLCLMVGIFLGLHSTGYLRACGCMDALMVAIFLGLHSHGSKKLVDAWMHS
jgi:hypothetical protein